MSNSLRTRVYNALDIAINENGYTELMTAPPSRVAVDLAMYDADLGTESIFDIVPIVEDYQKKVSLR